MRARICRWGAGLCLGIWASQLAGCGGRFGIESPDARADASDQANDLTDASSAADAGNPAANQAPESADSADAPVGQCVKLAAPALATDRADDLHIEYACGGVSATTEAYSDFLSGGQRCTSEGGINVRA